MIEYKILLVLKKNQIDRQHISQSGQRYLNDFVVRHLAKVSALENTRRYASPNVQYDAQPRRAYFHPHARLIGRKAI